MKVRIYYYGKFVFGIIAIAVFLWMYILNPENLNFAASDHWIGVDVFWWILLVDLLWRFIPGKFHHMGQQKYLKRHFVPTKQYVANGGLNEKERQDIRIMNRRAIVALGVFYLINALWLVFYILGIFRPQELFGLMLIYFVCDMICVLFFCPFRLLFLHHRCCTVCRIYNWDSVMLVTPLLLVPSLYSWTLGVIAIVYTILWEVACYRHPERFYSSSNASLRCSECTHGICPYKNKIKEEKDNNAEAS